MEIAILAGHSLSSINSAPSFFLLIFLCTLVCSSFFRNSYFPWSSQLLSVGRGHETNLKQRRGNLNGRSTYRNKKRESTSRSSITLTTKRNRAGGPAISISHTASKPTHHQPNQPANPADSIIRHSFPFVLPLTHSPPLSSVHTLPDNCLAIQQSPFDLF
ncbi:MAG: hypothetical protein JOS17DRAFT_582772 [Linnemannia elongata]|nr:MAG: hypothetical protein JOS17DRAFT_582772 [Linnemannia elongata]